MKNKKSDTNSFKILNKMNINEENRCMKRDMT